MNLKNANYFSNYYFNNIQPLTPLSYLRNNKFEKRYKRVYNQKENLSHNKRAKTPEIKKLNLNNSLKTFKNNARLGIGYSNEIKKHYNKDFMNYNKLTLRLDRMDENKYRSQNNFYKKKFENFKRRIHTEENRSMFNFDREILKALIYIYFYEKIVMEENIFYNSDKDFYLINPEWIKNFKKFYNYDKLEKKLKSFSTQCNYHNLDSEIEFIINNLSKENIFKNAEFFRGLKEINCIMTNLIKMNNITFTSHGIIIPAKIMNIIKNLNKDIKKYHAKKFLF